MKLVVTGHDAEGRSVFSHSGPPPRVPHPGSYDLWATQGPVRFPDASDPAAPADVAYFPSVGETTFKMVAVPPGRSGADGVTSSDISEFFDEDDPEMHTTDTLDYVFVVSGAADLELDDGRKERVEGGDCVVQRGTRHAWRVVGDEPLVLCAVMVGAERRTR